MFEGFTQANATAFSSFGSRATPPIVERQAFIMPQGVQAVAHTTTEKSITTKYLLFALQSGSVLQVSVFFLFAGTFLHHMDQIDCSTLEIHFYLLF